MFELIVLLAGAMPFLVGIFALRMIRKGKDEGSDDSPPPPDPRPPHPVMPPTPELRRRQRPMPHSISRTPARHARVQPSGWKHRVRCNTV